MIASGSPGAEAIEYERSRLVAVLGGQPHVEVLAGAVAGPAVDVEHERLDARRLLDDVEATAASSQRQSPQYRCSSHGSPCSVVAVLLPEAGLVLVAQLEPAHPLGALPEVEVRHEQPRRAAVLGLERLAVVGEGDPRLAAGQVLERQVRRVAAVAEREHVLGVVLDRLEQRVDRDAFPDRVELRPLRDAVDVARDLLARQGLNSSQVQRTGSRAASDLNVHSSSGVCGVGPAESTGKSSVRYCPGGTRSGGPSWRRPRNPREMIPTPALSPIRPGDTSAPRDGQ